MKLGRIVTVLFCVTVLGGCATAAAPTNGLLFTGVKGPVNSNEGTDVSSEGTACATNVLGLLAFGDASIEAAKRDGDIERVTTVDHQTTSILGLYAQFCTNAYGS